LKTGFRVEGIQFYRKISKAYDQKFTTLPS
jgi:hypothetical protein